MGPSGFLKPFVGDRNCPYCDGTGVIVTPIWSGIKLFEQPKILYSYDECSCVKNRKALPPNKPV